MRFASGGQAGWVAGTELFFVSLVLFLRILLSSDTRAAKVT